MFDLIQLIFGWSDKAFSRLKLNDNLISYLSFLINVIQLAIISYLIFYLFNKVLAKVLTIISNKTITKFDDILVSKQTTKYIALLIPLIFINASAPFILRDFSSILPFLKSVINVYIIITILWIIRTIFNTLKDHLKNIPSYSDKPIDSYIQVIMIGLWMFGVTFILSELFKIEITDLLATFGAISAIILLIFRDTILGFVASIQVSVNDMVRIGDWITMDKFGADGDVIEINLATVKVRNFDNTTTTIPTYSLISDSFRNWRGMRDSDGRRIKRHILIKSSSVRFINENELEEYKKIQLVKEYIESIQEEISNFNKINQVDKTLSINGRNLTNFGLYRKYLTNYLEKNQNINHGMLFICRHLQPTPHGIPLEIYAFSADKEWINYEMIMSDIFDHIFASVKFFNLEILEVPDFKKIN